MVWPVRCRDLIPVENAWDVFWGGQLQLANPLQPRPSNRVAERVGLIATRTHVPLSRCEACLSIPPINYFLLYSATAVLYYPINECYA
ncbi:hypothetical protein TNCV_1162031 [Trichonephila clavipes]|nr:hypothetical protein TNCV_1162031 [Trichonephila clavipes]